MEVDKRSSKGGFLQLFDWNTKSKKKLFSNKSDLPESSKHGKENLDNLAITRLQQMKLHDSMHGPSLTVNDWASSMVNNEGNDTKAPGVVARLMGLDSLPTLDSSDPGFTSFIDSHSSRHFESEHHFSDYGMRNKLDGYDYSRNLVEDRFRKSQNRPIERFQTEVLPPKSAKSVPISHHRMLSPIKSPGYILSRNPSYVMEAASKIIEQSPQSKSKSKSMVDGRLPSLGSPSIPIRIRDLKEKLEAAQRISRLPESQQRTKIRDKRQSRTEIVVLKQNVGGNLKQKIKTVGSTHTKTNIQITEVGSTSRNSRSAMKQKEDGDKKQKTTQKRVHNRSTRSGTHDVLTENNQKKKDASHKDRTDLKPRVPYQHNRKTTSTNGSCREVKTSRKSVENSVVGARKGQLVTAGKKRSTDANINIDATSNNKLLMREKEKERSVKCNTSIDGSSNWESVDRKNGMDVVSFTFTSPIKKSVSESEPSGQPSVKSRLKFHDDQLDTGTSEFPSFTTPKIDSDALNMLLEQKLFEISSLFETSECDIISSGSTTNTSVQKDKSMMQHDSDVSLADQILVTDTPEWQGVEVAESNSNSENYEGGIQHQFQQCSNPSMEPSVSDGDSCITSNSTTTLTSNGNNPYMSARNMELLAEEIELQDSATSIPNPIFEFTSMARWSPQWELEYIKKILNYAKLALEDFVCGQTQNVISVHLFNQLENQYKYMDPFMKLQRKALFDCVSLYLDDRRERAFSGSYEEWSKWSTMVNKKELLADEIHKEIRGWTNMEDLDGDDLVEMDMSRGVGKWFDFEGESLEEGVVIENGVLNVLIDEIVDDFLSC
ncbi:uncharacterized protein [Rutidosis leptorrhynchoides]|uniref:uncharacterized protein n=1 Tax=Rutidosis leptorrhynchoides TaxID=125765 RepID=UPI003A9994C5